MNQKIDLKDMLNAGVHFGHKTSRWSPKMRSYIWGAKNRVHLIDVSKTAFLLEQTGKFLKERAAEGKKFLWIGTKKPAAKIIKETAESLKMPYVINRWIGGSLSNFEQVKKAITRLLHLRDVVNKPTVNYTKKEIASVQKEIDRLEKNVGGIIDLMYPPEAIIIVDAKKEFSAVREAAGLNIPVIAMVDTNTDPDMINFVIPSNDDSPRSIQFIISYLASCVQEGIKLLKTKKIELKEEQKPVESKEDIAGIVELIADEDELDEEIGKKSIKASSPIIKKIIKKPVETTKEEIKNPETKKAEAPPLLKPETKKIDSAKKEVKESPKKTISNTTTSEKKTVSEKKKSE
ncbi:MAG: 30S ribosomal protein S2 [bacterium]